MEQLQAYEFERGRMRRVTLSKKLTDTRVATRIKHTVDLLTAIQIVKEHDEAIELRPRGLRGYHVNTLYFWGDDVIGLRTGGFLVWVRGEE